MGSELHLNFCKISHLILPRKIPYCPRQIGEWSGPFALLSIGAKIGREIGELHTFAFNLQFYWVNFYNY